MASGPDRNVAHDIYNVVDKDGNVVGKQIYPAGGSLYEGTKFDRENDRETSAFYSGAEQQLLPVKEGVYSTRIEFDPAKNKIKLIGPDFATAQIESSKWFKENFSGSSQLSRLLSLANTDSNMVLQRQDGTNTTVSDELDAYSKAFREYADAYASLAESKDRIKTVYNTELSDDQAQIAGTFYDKKDYNKNGVVYLPKWLLNRYDFSKFDSFNEELGTISAGDFFDGFYQESVADLGKTSAVIDTRNKVVTAINDFLNHGKFEKSDKNLDPEATRAILDDEEYREELARTLSIGKIVAENDPEADGILQSLVFQTSFAGGAINAMENTATGFMGVLNEIAQFPTKVVTDIIEGITGASEEDARGFGIAFTFPTALAATGFTLMGDILRAGDFGSGQYNEKYGDEFAKNFSDDMKALGKTTGNNAWFELADEVNMAFDGFKKDMKNVHAGSAVAGDVLGRIAWRIAEQIMFVNPLGNAAGSAISAGLSGYTAAGAARTVTSTSFLTLMDAKSIGTTLSLLTNTSKGAKLVGGAIKVLAFSGNVTAQGIFETVLDDSSAVHNLLATGDTEIFQIVGENIGMNAIFEGIGPTREALGKTAVGRSINSGLRNVTNRLGSWKDTVAHKLFDAMHKSKDGTFINAEGTHFKVKADAFKSDYLAESARMKKEAANVDTIKAAIDAEPGEKLKAYTDAIAKQQDIINKRVVMENAYDLMNASIRSTSKAVEGQLDAESVMNFYKSLKNSFDAGDALVKSGTLHAGLADDFLPKEAKEYLSLRAQLVPLTNKAAKNLTAEELIKKAGMEKRVSDLSELFGDEYKGTLDELFDNAAAYQHALNDYKIMHDLFEPGGVDNILGMRKDGLWGKDGIQYLHTQRIKPGENYSDLIKRSQDVYNGKNLRGARLNRSLADWDSGDEFADPIVLLFGDLMSTTSIMVQRTWQKALFDSAGVTKKFVATGDEYKVAKDFNKVMKSVSKDFKVTDNSLLSKTLRDTFDNNDIFAKAYNRTAASKTALDKAKKGLKRTSEKIGKTYDLTSPKTVSRLNSSMTVDDIAQLNKRLRVNRVPDFDISDMKSSDFKAWYDGLSDSAKNIIGKSLDGKKATFRNVKAVLGDADGGANLRLRLQRDFVANNPRIANSDTYQKMIREMREAEIVGRQRTILNNNIKKQKEFMAQIAAERKGGVDALAGDAGKIFRASVSDTTDDIVEQMSKVISENPSTKAIVDEFVKSGAPESDAINYLTLRQLSNMTRGDIKKALRKSNFASKALQDINPNIKASTVDHYLDNMADALKKNIESEYNGAIKSLADNKVANIVDPDELYNRVTSYMKNISDEVAEKNVIAIPAGGGKVEYFQTDPLTANLYVAKPGSFVRQITDYGDGAQRLIGFFNKTNRIFNWGTTGFSPKSFGMQWSRDSLNAIGCAGARPFLDFGVGVEESAGIFGHRIAGRITDQFVDTYGDRIIASLKDEYGEEWWKRFAKNAAETGDVKRAAVEFEIKSMGYGSLPGQEMLTTVGYFEGGKVSPKTGEEVDKLREAVDTAYGARMDRLFGDGAKMSQGKIDNAITEISKHQLGQWRETFLRQNVFTTTYAKALESGMAPTLARQYATRYALDSTTDFARPIFIGDSLAKAVPYFGAAINGAESFWRLLEIDPGGVAGRIIGGIIFPIMAGLAESLSDPTNREVYENIPEYEKEDNAIFVVHGEKISIPLPQEMSAFISPFRHAVEKANDANDISWQMLLTSDLLQLVPGFDLSGFVNIDANRLLSEPSFVDNIQRGAEKLLSGIMPVSAKALYKLLTGRDPYSGRNIDRSYKYYDDEGNEQIMDTTQSQFAHWLSSVFGGEISPSSAYSIFKDIIGQTFMDIGDGIVEAVQTGDIGKGFYAAADKMGKEVTGIVTDEVYSKSKSDWYYAMKDLEEKKAAIIMDKQFQNAASKVSQAKDEKDLRKWQGAYDQYVVDYRQQVLDVVNRLKNQYPGTYDRNKQAAVLSALNFSVATSRGSTAYARQLSQEQYFYERAVSVQTMQRMGFTSTEDNSILGYGVMVGNEYKFKWNSPLAILDAGNLVFGQENLHNAELKRILDDNEITRSKMFSKEYYSLTSNSAKKAYKEAWNAKVVKALAPYINQYGVDAVLEQYGVRDMLDNYLFVNPYKTKEYLYKVFGGDK